ncbi:hypothetical protein J4H92_10660 [Leucobacter weissii]|uniref:Uncharacterized protein n=2 Tax=Leucobacter weissii TaxID=1983706 RepID=A0A939MKG0_9MICO|nr:hypothetical protein [Leucobacter weissii]
MYELETAVRRFPGLHVRHSPGPFVDASGPNVDLESGLELPGLSADPLDPEDWWHRPVADWLARQLRGYRQLADREPDRIAWVLTGQFVGRGPDGEPLLANVLPVAGLSDELIAEAEDRYRTFFDAGRDTAGGSRRPSP